MTRRFGLLRVAVVSSVCILLLLASHQLLNNDHRHHIDFHRNQFYPEIVISNQAQHEWNSNGSLSDIQDIIQQQKLTVDQELLGFRYSAGFKLSSYTLATGGKPIRNLIIATWRTGSTFMAEVINNIPGNYYHYEPLLDFEIVQVRGPPLASDALNNIKKLLNCNYTHMDNYLNYGKSHPNLFMHNTRLWDQCKNYPHYCYNATFLTEFCRLYPFQTMKIVRLRLGLVEELLLDESFV